MENSSALVPETHTRSHFFMTSRFPINLLLFLFVSPLWSLEPHFMQFNHNNDFREGKMLESTGQYRDAIKKYERIIDEILKGTSNRHFSRDGLQNFLRTGQGGRHIHLLPWQVLFRAGNCSYQLRDYRKALTYYIQAQKKKTMLSGLDYQLHRNIGHCFEQLGNYQQAVKAYRNAEKSSNHSTSHHLQGDSVGSQRLKDNRFNLDTQSEISLLLGNALKRIGEYAQALEAFQKAYSLKMKLTPKNLLGTQNDPRAFHETNIAKVYYEWGRLDEAFPKFENAITLDMVSFRWFRVAENMVYLGLIQMEWGLNDQAQAQLQTAEAFIKKHNLTFKFAYLLLHDAYSRLYLQKGDFEKAITSINTCLRYPDVPPAQKLDFQFKVMELLIAKKEFRKAIAEGNHLIKSYTRIKDKKGTAETKHLLGLAISGIEKHTDAQRVFQDAINDTAQQKRLPLLSTIYRDLGKSFLKTRDFSKAETSFLKSIEIIEKVRLTAKGSVRRDYLAAQMETYRLCALSQARMGEDMKALSTVEDSSFKYLLEQMKENHRVSDTKSDYPSFLKTIPKDLLLLYYVNIPNEGLLVFSIKDGNVRSDEIPLNPKLFSSGTAIAQVEEKLERSRGFSRILKKSPPTVEKDISLEQVISKFRYLLTHPSKGDGLQLRETGRLLFDHLLGAQQDRLAESDSLWIIPDGILAYLPFEALIDPDGQYVVETHHVQYTHSLNVAKSLGDRRYSDQRKPLLAVGGVIHDKNSQSSNKKLSRNIYLSISEKVDHPESKSSLKEEYSILGYADWSDLPGSREEVMALSELEPQGEILVDGQALESQIHSLNRGGQLKDFKVLHFATHALAVPEVPDMSALVLGSSKEHDGYLNAKEIISLDIQADFVNLSACETGLGKIYSGEGVVGLTQAFLLAGAKSLCASLWQVADDSTKTFMLNMYQRHRGKDTSYSEAITQVKRSFIKNDKWKHPYFWAPFVFYGNTAAHPVVSLKGPQASP